MTLEPLRVTPSQAGVILLLRRHADARLVDAAAALRLQPPTMVAVVEDLVRKLWVTKRRSVEDRRAVCLRLSRQREAMAQTIAHPVCHVEAALTEFAYSWRMRTSVP